jgi:hypothetical protein
VYSLAEGDSLRTWRIEPFVMVEGGQRWLAPSMTAMTLTAGDKLLQQLLLLPLTIGTVFLLTLNDQCYHCP